MNCPGSREVPSWREYWMNQARNIASRSKDPSSQVGCVLVDKSNNPVSQGYNGFPPKCKEEKLTWDRPLKYFVVVHAEMNAVMRSGNKLDEPDHGVVAYVTDAPCENCLKHMAAKGIREVYYDKPDIMWKRSSADQKTALKMLVEACDMKVENFNTGLDIYSDITKPIPEETK